jgi:hypothetical protein
MKGACSMKALLVGVALFASFSMAQETVEIKTNETSIISREWTAVNGTKIDAIFVSKKNGMVTLKKPDGKSVVINEKALSGNDKQFLKDQPDTGEVKLPAKEEKCKHPEDAIEFNGHYYRLYTDLTSWDRASFKCKERGGYLVTINDDKENRFVYGMMKNHYAVWIGLYKNLEVWRWITAFESEYRNWAPNEPSFKKGTSSRRLGVSIAACIFGEEHDPKWRAHWDDRFGDDKKVTGYICEWEE